MVPTSPRAVLWLAIAVTAATLWPGPAAEALGADARREGARVRLGLHNYQPLTEPGSHLRLRRGRLTMRSACWLQMGTPMREVRTYVRTMEGLPAVFSGCASDPGSRKYAHGPMSAGSKNASLDLFGRGTSAVPSVAAYTRWLQQLEHVLGPRLLRWEVWNEADLKGFYRGSPSDLVDLTYAAARVFGRRKVIAPSFSTGPYYQPTDRSGVWENGRQLTKAEAFTRYWTLLVERARKLGEPLPVSAANIHSYGKGPTVQDARAARLDVLRTFRNSLIGVTGRYRLPIWDTEWNFRRMGEPHPRQGIGFADTRENVATWRQSVRDAACLGIRRQFLYTWTQGLTIDEFTATTLQLNPNTPRLLRAYRSLHGRAIACDGSAVGPSSRPLPRIPVAPR